MSITVTAPQDRAIPRHHRLLLIVIMAGLSAQSLIFTIPAPALPGMARALGPNGTWVGQLLFVLPSLGLMLTGLVSGWIAAQAGLRRSLIAAVLVYGVMGTIPLVSTNIPLLLASRFFLGAGCAVLSTGCTMLLAQSYDGEARARLLGYQAGAGSIAGLASLVLSGGLTEKLHWHAPFALYGITALFLLLVVGACVRDAPGKADTTVQGGTAEVLRLMWPVYVAACLLFTIPMASGSALPFVLQAHSVTSAFMQSIIISTFTVFSAAGAFLFGMVRARIGAPATLALGTALGGAGMLLIGLCPRAALAATGNGLAGLGLGLFVPHFWNVAAGAPEALRGRAVGLLNSAMFLGEFTSAFIIGALNHGFGRTGAFTAIGVAALLFTAALLAMKPPVLSQSKVA